MEFSIIKKVEFNLTVSRSEASIVKMAYVRYEMKMIHSGHFCVSAMVRFSEKPSSVF